VKTEKMERSAFTNEKSAVINEPVLQGRYKYEYLLSRDKEVDSALKLLTRFISLIPLSRGVLDRLDPQKEEGREERS